MNLQSCPPVLPTAVSSPIFILGILGRSGTNYLHDLLRLHPDCTIREPPIWEDNLLFYAGSLSSYCKTIFSYWKNGWGLDEEQAHLFYKCIGDGLLEFLSANSNGKRVVTKTPTVENIDLFFKLFPQTPLLVIVRDGRAVVESAIRSFPMEFEQTVRLWARNARIIDRFVRTNADAQEKKFLLIKYEDLVQNVGGELRKIIRFLDLDESDYDFDAAQNLPVRGSSSYKGDKSDEKSLRWDPLQKDSNFQPLERFRHWSKTQHQRFNWLAGEELRIFGYEPQCSDRSIWSNLRNRWYDVKWSSRQMISRNVDALVYRLRNKGKGRPYNS